jgi:hypothetical protein
VPEPERELAVLASALDWPETPDLATPVVARLGAVAPRRRARRVRRPLVVALAVLLLAAPAGAVAFPGARDDVLEWLGLRHVTVREAPAPPRAVDPETGPRLPLAEAARRARVRPLVPPQLEGAAAYETEGRLTLRGNGLRLEQRRGGLDAQMLEKIVHVASDVHRVSVGGRPGLWFDTLHAYIWIGPGGDVEEETPTRSGPALVWERGGRVLRLEGRGLTRARAIAIARAARPVPKK